MAVIAKGDEPGLFTPDDAPWVVHADFGTLVGGVRALLVQALHPATLAGVADHSRYEQDALGRLAGTIRWLTVTTFASHSAVAAEASRVNRLHERVQGSYSGIDARPTPYRAADPELLLWVHVAFTESFLTCHELLCDAPIPGGADTYVRQWGRSVAPLGLEQVPGSVSELNALLENFEAQGVLRCDARTREVVRFIRRPPLPVLARPVYRLFFAAAVTSLRPSHRELLGLRAGPAWLVLPSTRAVLKLIRFAIGPESPLEEAGKNRLRRIGAWNG